MEYKHHEHCDAPICQDDNNPDWRNERPWYAGEKICTKEPYVKFQKVQSIINKEVEKGTFRNMVEFFTANELETKSI